MAPKEDVKSLIIRRRRRLQHLQEQKAAYGSDTPPRILLEIDDIEAELETLKARLANWPDEEGTTETPATPRADRFIFDPDSVQAAGRTKGDARHLSGATNADPDAGDQISGDFESAALNVRAQLDRVTENIGVLPHLAQADKDELIRLIEQLKRQLEQVLPEREDNAEKVARRVEVLVTELAEEQLDVAMVETMGKTLKRAARSLADTMPEAQATTDQIVSYALALIRQR